MKKKLYIMLLLVAGILLTGCSNTNTLNSIQELEYADFEEKIDNQETFILEVVQTGCAHCEEFSPRFRSILADNDLTSFSINLYNLSSEQRRTFLDTYNVQGTPTVLFFEKGQVQTDHTFSGAGSDTVINERLEEAGYIN